MTDGRTTVLVGTAGSGKTQLAAAFARAWKESGQADLLAWVTASSRDRVVAAYAQAGVEVVGVDPSTPQRAAARFLAWLETTNRRWLVVLDDLADPADLRELWPPASLRGQALVTTRRRDSVLQNQDRRQVQVGMFEPGEAVKYLTDNLAGHGRADSAAEIEGLARDLEFLPLALAQAAAYLNDVGLDCRGYRKRLSDRRRLLPDLVPDPSGLPDDHRMALAAAWSLSIEQADRLPRRACPARCWSCAACWIPTASRRPCWSARQRSPTWPSITRTRPASRAALPTPRTPLTPCGP